ncbi:SIMPL domain-containing protein [Bradyrhizobium sp.]|uniref:SIMPL domain-containing protein n=1 Tax=Bradyrhizobium sp. TaxID=376 RepID=UPI002D2CC756|nr:SIMPL domain-containing protein [Bradyrhizobium sp.]HZR71912.1 SIMPL domain-containing protein [Bradyrhizobium sp.]
MNTRAFLRTLVLTVIAAGAPLAASAQTPTQPQPIISVTGEARVSVPPDLAQIDVGVTSEAKTAREASDANNAAMGKVLLALKGAGIDEKDYQTSRLSLQPEYSTAKSGSPATIVGYRASNRVTIRLHDVTKVANVIDTVVTAGANEIGGINFMVSQASKLLDDAREQAIADARRRAEIYAKAAGVTLGSPVSISEEGAAEPLFRARVMGGKMAAAAPVPIAQGEETLSVTVGVVWAIKPAQ